MGPFPFRVIARKVYLGYLLYLAQLSLSGPGFFFGCLGPGGGGGVPAAHNFKTIHGIAIKFGRVVENHKLINLV